MNYVTSSVTINAQATSSLSCNVETPFIAKVTVAAGETLTLYPYGTVNAQVDWGDGNLVTWTTTGAKSFTYSGAGQVTIRIYGTLTRLGDGITNLWSNRAKTLPASDGIVSLGKIGLTEVTGMCSSGMIVPTGFPTSLTSLQAAFYHRGNTTEGAITMPMSRAYRETVRTWNTANITNMRHCFRGCNSSGTYFEPSIPGTVTANWTPRISATWNTSNVTDMSYMYYESAWQDPGGSWPDEQTDTTVWQSWNTGNVTNMSYMFALNYAPASGFLTRTNSDNLSYWDTGSVTNMEGMFKGQPGVVRGAIAPTNVGDWDTSNVTNFSSMFEDYYFQTDTELSGTGSSRRFYGIETWNTGSATTMANMFKQISGFNLAIGAWDTSNVTTMENMFYVSGDPVGTFNQSLANWDVSQVTNMINMFRGQASYNQNLTGWCVTLIPSFPSFFKTNASWTQLPIWGTCPP
jgi:surface protein